MSDGDNLILGTDNNAESQTNLRRTGGGDESPGAYGLHVEFLDGHAVGGKSALGFGVEGISFGASGVRGTSTNGDGVGGTSSTAVGVAGGSTQSSGVRGTSFQGFGVEGFCFGTQIGVQGTCHNHIGVRGDSDNHVAIRGRSNKGIGVRGTSQQQSDDFNGGVGVHGIGAGGATGVAGVTQGGIGVLGMAQGRTGAAGIFVGNVFVTGTLSATTKLFRIDHPLNPKSKYLVHASVESPDMKTFYDGVVTLDKKGKATVRLPRWFEALNKDFRYQLTPIGAPAPNLHVADEVTKNQFKLAGGTPGMKVCWQVTGIRQDKWAKDQPLAVEQDKRSEDVRFLDAQSPQQVEAFNRWLKEDQAETQALMSAQSQRMEEVRKAVETKKKK
ncbi:MAG: hypothetical protein QOD25_3550 [Alphaproteobacteria bacterium]|jgi:hypothetical protein|nr:hypothetical protein [Alphaproteobacteria bacterium]